MIEQLIAEARTWLGTPYHHEANLKGAGVDCAMILVEVYAAAGLIEWFDPRPYPRQWMLHRSEERYVGWVEQFADEVPRPMPGDIVLMRYGRTFSHSGIIIEGRKLIHAYARDGFVTWGDLGQEPFAGRQQRFYRFRTIR